MVLLYAHLLFSIFDFVLRDGFEVLLGDNGYIYPISGSSVAFHGCGYGTDRQIHAIRSGQALFVMVLQNTVNIG